MVLTYFSAVSSILISSHRSLIVFFSLTKHQLTLCVPLSELLYCHKILLNMQHKVYAINYGQHQEMLLCGIFALLKFLHVMRNSSHSHEGLFSGIQLQQATLIELLLIYTFYHLLGKIILSYQADTPVLLFILL